MFQCMRCQKSFNVLQGFHQHFHQVHREKNFQCAQCSKLFSLKSTLTWHLKFCFDNTNEEEPNLEISVVKKAKRIKLKGIEYIVIKDNDLSKKYQCKRCEKKFKIRHNFTQHFHHVHKEKKIKCELCDKLFPFKNTLIRHMKIDHNSNSEGNKEMKFKCEKCDTPFPFKSLWKHHVGICNGIVKDKRQKRQILKDIEYKIIADENSQKIFQCMRCNKKFNIVQYFHQHFRFAHKEKNFQCAECARLFHTKSNLIRHLKVCSDNSTTEK